ncbi:hypothetical protein TRAPUB_8666 [Trametes pubescens]|uniref:Uncharacterized protein n=1 Tax=Trametes pubescens TaxID=154538 RepID=A0A1M2W4I3_TRAPU|nr:hypothetical protein TRAPUB_8666 [Trametes pubescens]
MPTPPVHHNSAIRPWSPPAHLPSAFDQQQAVQAGFMPPPPLPLTSLATPGPTSWTAPSRRNGGISTAPFAQSSSSGSGRSHGSFAPVTAAVPGASTSSRNASLSRGNAARNNSSQRQYTVCIHTEDIDPAAPPSITPRRKKNGYDEDEDEDEDDGTNNTKKKKRTYQAWSIIPVPTMTSGVARRLVILPEHYRLAATLVKKITTTHTYMVGPMDFCGIARLERAQGGAAPIYFLSTPKEVLQQPSQVALYSCNA